MNRTPLNARLQAEIEAHAADVPEPTFPRLELRALVPVLRRGATVDARPLLIGRTAYERMWVVINRGVRAVIKHAAEPVVDQQNAWNNQMAHTIERLASADAAMQGEVVRLRAEATRRGD